MLPVVGLKQSRRRHNRRTMSRATTNYFLNKLSKAVRASLAFRGAGTLSPFTVTLGAGPTFAPSFATVTRGRKSSQVFAWSFTGILTGIGFTH
jgi:hypothetical protein